MTFEEKGILKHLVGLRAQGKSGECIEAIAKALIEMREMSPSMRHSLLGLRSDCYLDLQEWQAAIQDLDALLKESTEAPLLTNKALALWHLGDLDSAFQGFSQALKSNPTDQVTLRNMGRLEFERGNQVAALACLRAATKVGPGEVLNHLLLADALVNVGDYAGAFAEYVRVLQLDCQNVRAQEQLQRLECMLQSSEQDQESTSHDSHSTGLGR